MNYFALNFRISCIKEIDWWSCYNFQLQYDFNGSNTDGSFSTAVSNSFSSPLTKNHPAADLGLIRVIFVFKLKMVYCVFSLESPRWGDSNENTQHTFMLKKWKITPILPPDLELWLTLIRSNYPCLEHNFIVPKVFEPLKFYCNFQTGTPDLSHTIICTPPQDSYSTICFSLKFIIWE